MAFIHRVPNWATEIGLIEVRLSEEEKQLLKDGKIDVNNIEQYRKEHPLKEPEPSELEKVKKEIRETNILYKEAIQKNKDLYNELVENRNKKEELRDKIAELRKKKKELLGV